jgi:hypothetical protein
MWKGIFKWLSTQDYCISYKQDYLIVSCFVLLCIISGEPMPLRHLFQSFLMELKWWYCIWINWHDHYTLMVILGIWKTLLLPLLIPHQLHLNYFENTICIYFKSTLFPSKLFSQGFGEQNFENKILNFIIKNNFPIPYFLIFTTRKNRKAFRRKLTLINLGLANR